MNIILRAAVSSLLSIPLLCCASCDLLLGLKPIELYDQALDVFDDVVEQSFGIRPYLTVTSSSTTNYTGQAYSGTKLSGSASFRGTHAYTFSDFYIDSDSHREVRRNSYELFSVSFSDFQRFDYHMKILSGLLTISGYEERSTRLSDYSSTTTDSGSIRITGTVEVKGRSSGRDVKDRVSINVTRSLTGTSWFWNGTISNGKETWDIYME